ncbi:MAG: FAD-dependent oxidoreductase [Nitratireductor sp.]
MRDDIVIVGGGQAALSCAARLREGGHQGAVVMIGAEPWLPYQRPPLSKAYLLGKTEAGRLGLRAPEFFDTQRIAVRTGTRVHRIDRAGRAVELADGERLEYGRLVLATGSRARTLPETVAGGLDGVFTLRGIDDAERLRAALADAGRVLVVGGGYIGLEVAAIAAQTGRALTVVEQTDRLLRRVACAQTAAAVGALHGAHGVDVRTGASLARLMGDGSRVRAAVLDDGSTVAADLVLVGIGGIANDDLAAAAGLAVDGGILVDASCRTSDPAIFAAGDCAVFPFAGRRVRLESVQNAVDQGIAVADALLGRDVAYAPVPWFWSDQYDAKLQSVGLALDYDRVIPVAAARAGGWAFWYFRAGTAVAVDTINDARTHMAARRLFASGAALSPDHLLSSQFDLMQYVRADARAAS